MKNYLKKKNKIKAFNTQSPERFCRRFTSFLYFYLNKFNYVLNFFLQLEI